jgi:hypothetical protein
MAKSHRNQEKSLNKKRLRDVCQKISTVVLPGGQQTK